MSANNLHQLLTNELQNLYSAEQQITQAVPQILKFVESDELRKALTSHLDETHNQSTILSKACKKIGIDPEGKTSLGMEGIFEEATELMQEGVPSLHLDLGLIACAQKVEHYEIAGYGTVVNLAKQMGLSDFSNDLIAILEEEKNADQKLTTIANSLIAHQQENSTASSQSI